MNFPDYENYTDEELAQSWNHLETCRLSPWVEAKMNKIEEVLKSRGVVAWNADGEITVRDER